MISADFTSKNLAHFSFLNDSLLFQKYKFFIQFFCKNRNRIFCEKFFAAENYCLKIALIFFQIDVWSMIIRFRDFWNTSKISWFSNFFPFFFCEVCRSAVFQSMCRKCMSGDSSILPVSKTVPFKKQMRIFTAIFEKKIALWHHFSDFCKWCESRHFVLCSLMQLQKIEFFKNLQ